MAIRNIKKFFTSRAIALSLLLLFGLTILIYKRYVTSPNINEVSEATVQEQIQNSGLPVFVWKYEKDDSLNPDGQPNTNIFLEAKYPSGITETKLIDTTPGSCNDLPESDIDTVPGSTNIQCYSAGLGYTFKITKGENSYIIKRKIFEEASPEYNPPLQEYQVVSEFFFEE